MGLGTVHCGVGLGTGGREAPGNSCTAAALCMVHGAWYMVLLHGTVDGAWYTVHGAWWMVDGGHMVQLVQLVHGAWCMVHCTKCNAHCAWCMVEWKACWSTIIGWCGN